MTCCKCNKTGRCRNCSCVKAGIHCQSCLSSRLGLCQTLAQVPRSAKQLQQVISPPPKYLLLRLPYSPSHLSRLIMALFNSFVTKSCLLSRCLTLKFVRHRLQLFDLQLLLTVLSRPPSAQQACPPLSAYPVLQVLLLLIQLSVPPSNQMQHLLSICLILAPTLIQSLFGGIVQTR